MKTRMDGFHASRLLSFVSLLSRLKRIIDNCVVSSSPLRVPLARRTSSMYHERLKTCMCAYCMAPHVFHCCSHG